MFYASAAKRLYFGPHRPLNGGGGASACANPPDTFDLRLCEFGSSPLTDGGTSLCYAVLTIGVASTRPFSNCFISEVLSLYCCLKT